MNATHPLVGKTLAGRFRITKLLGEGAMASVLQAEQDAEPRHVAIKVMRQDLAADPSFGKRFRREARAALLLDHPNTVKILDLGEDGMTHYIVMELLRGRDLFDTLAAEGRLSEARTARIVVQVCDALAAAHGQGIIHRDLKPENVWIEPDALSPTNDRVKVLDFGIAKLLDPDVVPKSQRGNDAGPPSSHLVTMVGTVVGTPEYMSPEQCRGEQVGPRSDVYACGALLYALLTGRPPFVSDLPIEITIKHCNEEPLPPSRLRPGLSPALEAIVLAALKKLPDDRPKSAAEMRDALSAILPRLSEARPTAAGSVATTVVSASANDPPPPPPPQKPFARTLASEEGPPMASHEKAPQVFVQSHPGAHPAAPAPAAGLPAMRTPASPGIQHPGPRLELAPVTRRGGPSRAALIASWVVAGVLVVVALVLAFVMLR